MRHRKKGRKFNRITGRRRSFLRNLTNDLIRSGRIETTEARAKEIRPLVEKFLTIAKKQNLAGRRLLLARLQNEKTVERLMDELAPRYASRTGGYLRILKSSKARKRDGSQLAIIEFIQ